ncbi:flavin reductase family protein [Rhizobiaceae sp. 2RAB30]
MPDEPDTDAPDIDVKTFWTLIGARPVAVPVVAARDTAGPAGLLALSATHVSASPPTMLVAVGRSTGALKTIRASGAFSINYLAEGAEETADIFGGRKGVSGADRFAQGQWSALSTGAPVLDAAVAAFDCRVDRIFEYHETELIVGRIVAYRTDTSRRPLLSFRGTYTGLAES